ncbi:MAG TPA: acyl-CoA dehydrogenase family protein [Acidimicrobiia bacterium]|jgi:alkylation response protein AidB-like acyl-CoA dehydrogenase
MNFDLSEDQVALRDGIRSLLEGKFPMSRVREGFDRSTYEDLKEAGVFSLRGDGFGWTDAAVVYEELGRALVPGPLVWTFGRDTITGGLDLTVGGTTYVEHLATLDGLLVLDADGITSVDPARIDASAADWPLDPLTPVSAVASLPAGSPVGDADALAALRTSGALLTAAFCVGMADALVDLAVAYAKEREQFNRPIGSFQAVKHLCADMAVRAEVARAAVYAAACVLDDPSTGELARALGGAKLLANEAAITNGKSATQVFGGMGFTWEVDVHLYLKRAWVLDTHFGSIDHHADAVAATL